MSAKIRHLALYTENQDRMATFYQQVFGMKRITRSFNDPNKGHISDGVIGLAVLNRRPGFAAALDHFGFEVDDVGDILDVMKQKYPKTLVTKGLEQVAFAVFRSHDPAGTQFDISWKEHPKVQQGYKEDGWQQPRQINHIALRASEPEQVAEFYHEVFGLKEGKNFRDEDTLCVTDGTVDLVIRRTTNHSYTSMRQGLDHFGFAVESLEDAKKDLAELATSFPASVPKDIAGGIFGHITKKDMDGCRIGQYSLSDPDGIVLDLSERAASQGTRSSEQSRPSTG